MSMVISCGVLVAMMASDHIIPEPTLPARVFRRHQWVAFAARDLVGDPFGACRLVFGISWRSPIAPRSSEDASPLAGRAGRAWLWPRARWASPSHKIARDLEL